MDVESKDERGSTAIILAAQLRQTHTVAVLLIPEADIEAKNNEGTHAMTAAPQNHLGMELIRQQQRYGLLGLTTLLSMLLYDTCLLAVVVKVLLEAKANNLVSANFLEYILHLAIEDNAVSVITPLAVAEKLGKHKAADLLAYKENRLKRTIAFLEGLSSKVVKKSALMRVKNKAAHFDYQVLGLVLKFGLEVKQLS